MIEAALITPMLLIMTFAILDFSMILYTWLTLESGVSQATRYAITGNLVGGMSREESIKQAFRAATPTLNVPDGAFSFSHMSGGGGGGWTGGAGQPNDIEKVTVTYTYDLMVLQLLMGPLFDTRQINFTVESAMKNEGVFQQ
jgi:Flp pilus assembly protein TadG